MQIIRRYLSRTVAMATALLALQAPAQAADKAPGKTRVACIGNSITYGMTLPDRERTSYPARLQQMLGTEWEVGNFGRNGATLLRKGHNPWHKTPECAAALEFAPDVAVIHLGTNDTDPRNWPNHSDEFMTDYLWLIDTLRAVNPQVRIIVANMAPIGTSHHRWESGTRQWRQEIRRLIPHVAEAAGAELIDFRTPLVDRSNLVPDNLHPDTVGAALLAEYVHGAITGRWGGLKLPQVVSSGMVVPHGRYWSLRGTDNAGLPVTVEINGRRYSSTADNTGRWSVTLEPLPAGGPYTLTVSDPDTTAVISDVMAGEVWLASGQSNMEFRLDQAIDTPADLVSDSLLRVFRMSDVQRPDAGAFPAESQQLIDNLQYYRPARWAMPDGALSAVAWHFGRMLADSLRIPVGIIANPVGGAGVESFIDVETLQEDCPGVLRHWLTNDYVQPWVQQRAAENMGGDKSGRHRHAYEPSYLYSAGVRQLEGYPVSGVIWYQGESNAHNVELHSTLFPLLLKSWRHAFGRPDLPFITVQLSGINRPSWPAFRQSQRLMAAELPHVHMAVSSDRGDPTDVHPRRKADVGRRLARQALHHVYGMAHVTPQGPDPVKAEGMPDGSVRLIFSNGHGLTSADGAPLRSFELAQTPGLFRAATVTLISNDTIIITSQGMTKPIYARYGWQPFTDANLINSDSLPASTFAIEVTEVEPGIEHGVSAAFAGTLPDGNVLMAGGCNFPYPDPLAAGLAKVYYRGIYRAADGTRIGSLPAPAAYGASASTPLGIVLIGGENSADCRLLTADEECTEARLTPLPALPAKVDNAYACAIGTRVFVAGGNADGVPSRQLLELDLANPSAGWKRHPDMPGHARVQPVAAAAQGKVWVWGGFAPRHAGQEPTLCCDGLCFDPATGTWTPLPAPKAGKTELTLSGGVAATVADGAEIVCTGGVNKDVFLSAIRKQPADYLQHPVEWYRFNGHVCRFNPATGTWSVTADANPDYARAGAACALLPDGTPLLMGGELKPRIRTPRFTPLH